MRFITLDSNNAVISIRFGKDIANGEIQSDVGEIGQVMQPDGSFTDPVKTLDEVKNDKINKLKSDFYGSFTTFQSNALGTMKTYPIDTSAQKNFKDYQDRLIADTNKDSFYFKTLEDVTLVNHTRAQFLQLLQDGETFQVNQTIKLDNLMNQVNNATTIDEVNAIVWS